MTLKITLLLEYSFQNRVFKFKVSWHLHYPPRKQVLVVLQTRKLRPREVQRPAQGQTPREAAGQSLGVGLVMLMQEPFGAAACGVRLVSSRLESLGVT